MRKFKKTMVAVTLLFVTLAASAVHVTTSCGGQYQVIGCQDMRELMEVVADLESLC